MKIKYFGIFTLFLFSTLLFAQTASEYYDAAQKAYKARDYKAFVENLQKTLDAGSNHPRIYYNLACGYALLNDSQKAIEWLNQIAALGIAYPVEEDQDLSSIRQTPGFQNVLRKFKQNQQPVIHSKVAFTLPENFVPEGLTYNPAEKSYFAGSILLKKIVRIDSRGNLTDFSSPEDGLYEVLGMSIDHSRKLLWASSARFIDADSDTKKVSALFLYDLKSKKLLKRYDLPSDQPHQLGDVIVNHRGDAFTTDSLNPAIYRVNHDSDTLEKLDVGDLFRSPQGLSFSADEKILFVADYVRGIFAIDLAAKKHWNLKTPADVTIAGIDGLYQYGDQLIATQNGFAPNRVLRLTLNDAKDAVARADTLEAGEPRDGEFTLGVIAGDEFYFVANSQLERYYENRNSKLSPTVIRKLDLRKR